MGWEQRKGRSYYYKSERVGGRVRKTYLGNDEVARCLAEADAASRRIEELRRERWRTEKERVEAGDAALEELCKWTDLLVETALRNAGYDKRRGQWRRKSAEREARQAAARRDDTGA